MGDLARALEEAYREKERIRYKLESLLGEESRRRALRDHHSRRKPRPCGMTIHTGIGCSYGCIYCYIWDMGFPGKPKPYPLDPLELAYALAANPYVVPGHTLAAYGSVTEPFLEETREKALAYIAEIHKWLRLPSQVSTKSLLTNEIIEGLLQGDPQISVLVTVIVGDELARKLEPRAPPPSERLRHAGIAVERGLNVTLFMRPLIPGVPLREYECVLREAVENGIKSVVFGSLRVTKRILEALESISLRIEPSRILGAPSGKRQVPVDTSDFKSRLKRVATQLGLTVYPAACAANICSHEMKCWKCRWGPCCGSPREPGSAEVEEAVSLALQLFSRRSRGRVRVSRTGTCSYRVYSSGVEKQALDLALYWVSEVSACRVGGR